jgi:CRP-like cAMP-binding protein
MKKLTKDAGLKLLSMMDVVEIMAHKVVFLQGDKNDYVYVVLKGRVDIFLNISFCYFIWSGDMFANIDGLNIAIYLYIHSCPRKS